MTPRAVATPPPTACKSLTCNPRATHTIQDKIPHHNPFKMQELIHRRSDMRMADQLLPTRFRALKYGPSASALLPVSRA
jgi:hypothetical protein